jgi:glycyl-tRNA synthetase beta chain
MAQDLLLEIGVEELPASFVTSSVASLPRILAAELDDLRLTFGSVSAAGTPRRLMVTAKAVAEKQTDLDAEVTGPPARIAFDGEGKPTRAAESFAAKSGVDVADLYTVSQKKGDYVAARQRASGQVASELLPKALASLCAKIAFKKSMRWSDGDTAFGRPVRWLMALFGDSIVKFDFAGLSSSNFSYGHRFLAPEAIRVGHPVDYEGLLARAHVTVDVQARQELMTERLREAAEELRAVLIDDAFLLDENASLVEDPQVVAGSFEARFLELPERVILDVARDHQRYFGVRDESGALMPNYLAVVNTAQMPDNVRRGNDRVMRARLADAKFFYDADLERPLGSRRVDLDNVMFQKRLGSVGEKVSRLVRLSRVIGAELGLSEQEIATAASAAELCKCDLVTLMVGEFPELQGEMGKSYALAQGVNPDVAEAIAGHYSPKGASDPTAKSSAGAIVALADRLDTLVGCCAINIMPSGSADPLALRRTAIGLLRTLIDHRWGLDVAVLVRAAHREFDGVQLDLSADETVLKLSGFLRHRLRGVLTEQLPQDAVDACLDADAGRPHDVALRARALSELDPSNRLSVGEVFKRAANIAKDAPAGDPVDPATIEDQVHPSEQALFGAFRDLATALGAESDVPDYASVLAAISEFSPVLGRFFEDVFVMTEEAAVRDNRLRMMAAIHSNCSRFASFNLLAKRP